VVVGFGDVVFGLVVVLRLGVVVDDTVGLVRVGGLLVVVTRAVDVAVVASADVDATRLTRADGAAAVVTGRDRVEVARPANGRTRSPDADGAGSGDDVSAAAPATTLTRPVATTAATTSGVRDRPGVRWWGVDPRWGAGRFEAWRACGRSASAVPSGNQSWAEGPCSRAGCAVRSSTDWKPWSDTWTVQSAPSQ
jgi:hypothetical protein